MEATVDPQPRGPDWMPITPKTGSLLHADSHLNAEGQIAWRASPWMLSRLADAEREVQDDMEDLP